MQFRSLFVIAAGLAAFASASPIDNLVGTVTQALPASLTADRLLPPPAENRPVPSNDPYLQGCRAIDLEEIERHKMDIDRFTGEAIAWLRDHTYIFEPWKVRVEDPRLPLDGKPCQEVRNLGTYHSRMIRGETMQYDGQSLTSIIDDWNKTS